MSKDEVIRKILDAATTGKHSDAIEALDEFTKQTAIAFQEWVKVDSTGKQTLSGDTGNVFLSLEDCGAGVVTHELLHAVLWAWKHKKNKQQYPVIIKNMRQEEELLHNHTFAVTQFYTWFWKVAKEVKK